MTAADQLQDLLNLTRPLIAFDLETTGKNPKTARIVEIGFTQIRPGQPVREWHSLVNPGIPIPKEAQDVHGISDEDVLQAPRWEQIAADLAGGFSGCDFAGKNIKYDIEVFATECARVGVKWAKARDVRLLDAQRLWQLLEPRTLTDAVRYFLGRDHGDAHGASADARGALEVIVEQLTRRRDYGRGERLPASLDKLHELQFPRDPNAVDEAGKLTRNAAGAVCFVYGKHAGVALRNVDRGYIEWALNAQKSGFPEETLEHIRQHTGRAA